MLVLIAATLAGCSGADLVPVEGVVTLDGQPLVGGTVTLQRPDGPPEGRFFVGETDAQGRFVMKSAKGNATGAMPGEYYMTITSVKLPPNANELTPIPKERVPAKFRSQTFAVPAGGTTEANFVMTSR